MNKECKEIFNGLVSNAFDFLNHSVDEFDEYTKYSVIHFCIAVENILKAELIWYDWRLVFVSPKKANMEDFKKGNFISATTGNIITRLRENAGIKISQEAVNAFKSISERRNKIVHFSTNESSIVKEDIIAEQARAWYHLDKLLRAWHHHYTKFIQEKRKFRERMSKQNKYLSTRYEMIVQDLENLDKKNYKLASCPLCLYKAIVVTPKCNENTKLRCKVCDNEYQLKDL